MFTSSLKSLLYGGSSVPPGYESPIGTFSGASSSPQPSTGSYGLSMSTDQRMTSMLEVFTTSNQHIHMVSSNSSDPQVTLSSVYY